MIFVFKKTTLILCTLFASATLFIACDTTSSGDHDEHPDPFGATLIMNGVEIATQEGGVITYHEGDHLELEVGEETNLIQIRWISEDGDRFTPEVDEGYSLQWIIEDENILEVEQHEEDGPWSFHLVGQDSGETTIVFELWHNNHSDFTTLPFEVHVEEVVSGMELQDENGESIVVVNNSGEVSGSIDLTEGESAGPLTAVFLDHDDSEIDTDHDYELEWHLNGSEFASIDPVQDNPFSFTINGISSGQADVHFSLIKRHDDHGEEDDHDDEEEEISVYESPDILINVN